MTTITLTYPQPDIALVTLNRPGARNALSWQMATDLYAALDDIDRNHRCRVVVLTGAGQSFCAGLDLMDQANPESLAAAVGEIGSGPRAGMRAQEYMAGLVLKLRRIQQPIIAAVNGHAYGGGLGLALACDVRIAAADAKFCTQFIRLGVSGCDIGVSYTLPRLIGAARAHDMMITARVVDAAQAETWGLVTRVEAADALLEEALALAESMCDFSPYGLVSTKQGMWANLDASSLDAAMQLENRNQILNGLSGDVEEAAAAFFENRKPDFFR
ncbi:enoyl-CoA hydratase/isomerase family protein [Litorivivens sp.]|uniref:enoyl-CoA hydratase/isomerase family protein n=1 Tax=Litorivivens sp. TaxID=2020868 RepID=UPI00356650D9